MKMYDLGNASMPALGFGTWQLKGQDCLEGVEHALATGYRHIDTAQAYENEEQVGQAIKNSNVPRTDIFLTTKIWMDQAHDGDAQRSLDESLKKLQTESVDLVLMHWPVKDVPFEETFRAFEEILKEGKAKTIGVSNFTVDQMRTVKEELGVNILCNQVEYHPTLSQQPVLDFIRDHDMVMTAYSPIARGHDLDIQDIKTIAEAHGKSVAQVIMRWLIQQDRVAAIPKSSHKERIEENFDIFDFELSEAEMQTIFDQAREDGRQIDPEWAPDWDNAKAA